MDIQLVKFEDLVMQLEKKNIYLKKKKVPIEILDVEKR